MSRCYFLPVNNDGRWKSKHDKSCNGSIQRNQGLVLSICQKNYILCHLKGEIKKSSWLMSGKICLTSTPTGEIDILSLTGIKYQTWLKGNLSGLTFYLMNFKETFTKLFYLFVIFNAMNLCCRFLTQPTKYFQTNKQLDMSA